MDDSTNPAIIQGFRPKEGLFKNKNSRTQVGAAI